MAGLLLIVLVVVVGMAAVVGVEMWWWTHRRRPFVSALAAELYAQAQMDAMTRRTAQAMRDAIRVRPDRYGQL